MGASLDPVLLSDMDAYWRAANYLSVGQMYLLANPLLCEPLKPEHVKPRVLGNWAPTPGQNLIYVHLNRVIKGYDLNMIYVAGPGHTGPAFLANAYLEGTYSELYPDITQDKEGLRRLFEQFSFLGGLPSRLAPETLGAAQKGGELGRPLCRAYGAACGKPDLLVACVVGDGDAETGPLSLTWEANEVVNPALDGAVLPILHLTGCKIANSTILTGPERAKLGDFLHANGYHPYFVEGDDPAEMHPLMAQSLDAIVLEIGHIQSAARLRTLGRSVQWPVLVVCTPSGWTGPRTLDGPPARGAVRAHHVPLPEAHSNPAQLATLELWLRSYRPGELFDRNGKLHSDLADLAPRGGRRMGSNSQAIGGAVLKACQ